VAAVITGGLLMVAALGREIGRGAVQSVFLEYEGGTSIGSTSAEEMALILCWQAARSTSGG